MQIAFSKVHPTCHRIVNGINQEVTLKRLLSMLRIAKNCMLGRKVIFVRCISCSQNIVAKSICLLDKKQFLFIPENFHASKSF